jgi:phosphopantetheine adenylyltransferase
MQEVHIICTWDQLQPMEQALEEQFEAQKEKVTILDWGTSYKKEAGYIVVEWEDEVDAAFIDQLTADNDVEDFSVYTVPCITDGQLCILESAELEM